MSDLFRDWAVAYARAGLSVHPLPAGEKKSRLPWAERQRVRLTPEQVHAHWTRNESDNIAIITGTLSGVVVVDVDPAHGGDPVPFEGLTPVHARTRAGGWHFYFKHPGRHVQSRAGVLPGIDIRGDGGYVVAPPSRVEPGRYSWGPIALCCEDGTRYQELPGFDVAERLLPQKSPSADTSAPVVFEATEGDDWISQALSANVPMGGQRQALLRLAGYFAGNHLPADVAYRVLLNAAMSWRQNRQDPWMPDQVREIVDSIYEREGSRSTSDPLVGLQDASVASATAGAAASPSSTGSTRRLRPVSFDAFMDRWEGQRALWTVEDWLPQATIAMVYSPPGAFKTWLLAELALSVALGEPFLGRHPVHQPGPVLFVQQEDPAPLLASRFGPLAVSKVKQEGDWFVRPVGTPIHLLTDGFQFGSRDCHRELVETIAELRPVLVIMDPLYTMLPAANFFVEMATHLAWLKRVRERFECSFLIAHHQKKQNADSTEGREQMFGSNLMNAAIESGWRIRPVGEKSIAVARHFKVAANRDRLKLRFDIDLDRVPAFIATEVEDDPAVDPAEQGELDAEHELILATLRQEAKPLATRTLVKLVGKPRTTVQRKVGDLIQRGILVRDAEKRIKITDVNPKEVA